MGVPFCGGRIAVLVSLLFYAGGISSVSASDEAAKVALVKASSESTGDELLDLASVVLSNSEELTLLDRDHLSEILAERQLLQDGLLNSPGLLAVGRLLNVDLFAVLETYPGDDDARGLVVFDARNGIRYQAITLNTEVEEASKHISNAVLSAIEKRKALSQQKNMVTLSLGEVRNASLPASYDVMCEAFARLLERSLVKSPELVFVERSHLGNVNLERELPGTAAEGELHVSSVALNIDLSADESGKGLRARLMLMEGETGTNTLEAIVRDQDLVTLVDMLVMKLADLYKVGLPEVTPDKAVEAARYRQMANFQGRKNNWREGLRWAEAAAALDPDDFQNRLLLGFYLCEYAYSRRGDNSLHIDGLLEVCNRSLDLTLSARDQMKSLAMNPADSRYTRPENGLASPKFWRQLTPRILSSSKKEKEWHHYQSRLRKALVEDYLGYMSEHVNSTKDMSALIHRVINTERRLEGIVQSSDEWIDSISTLYARWLPHAEQYELNEGWELSVSRMLSRTCAQIKGDVGPAVPHYKDWKLSSDDVERLRPLYSLMKKNQHPAVAAYGRIGLLLIDERGGALSSKEKHKRFRDVISFIKSKCEEEGPSGKYKTLSQIYIAGLNLIDFAMETPELRQKEYDALFEYMLSINHVQFWVVWYAVDPNVGAFRLFKPPFASSWTTEQYGTIHYTTGKRPKEDYSTLVENRDRAIKLWFTKGRVDARVNLWCTTRGSFAQALDELLAPVYKAMPELRTRQDKAFWTSADPLFELPEGADMASLHTPLYHNGRVYVSTRFKNGQFGVGYIPVKGKEDPWFSKALGVEGTPVVMSIDGKRFALGMRDGQGVYLHDVDGGTSRLLGEKDGLPSGDVHAIAQHDGVLYLGLGGGYLASYNLAEKRCDVLISSKRLEQLSPLDNTTPGIKVTGVYPDAPRKRILFLLNFEKYLSCEPRYGVWQLDLTNGQISQVLSLFRGPIRMHVTKGDMAYVLFSGYASGHCPAPASGLVTLNLADDKATLIGAWGQNIHDRANSAGPDLHDTGETIFFPMHSRPPFLHTKNWVWIKGAAPRNNWNLRNRHYRILDNGKGTEMLPVLESTIRPYKEWSAFYVMPGAQRVIAVSDLGVWRIMFEQGLDTDQVE